MGLFSLYAYVALLAASPISELRGAIPFGIGVGLPLANVVIIALLANLLIIPLLFILLKISGFRSLVFRVLGKRIQSKIDKNKGKFELYGELALIPFVAVPLPLTGAYTGVLIAEFMGWSRIKSGLAIALGVLLAGVIVLLASVGLFALL